MKLGYLLKCGDQTEDGQEIGSRDVEKIACNDGEFKTQFKLREGRAVQVDAQMKFEPKKFVFTSPSFAYACHNAYAEGFDGGHKIILEFRLKQESYIRGPQTLRSRVEDEHIETDAFEFFTARHGVMMLTGIIVKPTSPKPCSCTSWAITVPRAPTTAPFRLACPNAARRWTILLSLGISPLLFNHAFDRCYCGCQRLPDFILEGGRKYVLPKPGTRFSLFLDNERNDTLGCFGEWHTCFHGTTFAALAPVLECGYLLYPGSITVYGEEVKEREHRADGTRIAVASIPTNTICVSPSVAYASHPVYAKPMARGGHRYRVALQCKIRPDAYQAHGSTLRGVPDDFDPYVSLAEMEWHTRRCCVRVRLARCSSRRAPARACTNT
jgi:hypothetical protein